MKYKINKGDNGFKKNEILCNIMKCNITCVFI